MKCEVTDCWKDVHAHGYCRRHWALWRRNGKPERVLAQNRDKTCKVADCDRWAWKKGLCSLHYQRQHRYGSFERPRNKRGHPLYVVWNNYFRQGVLAEEWHDFWKFIETVGARPSSNHVLVRAGEGLLGPSNWQWYEKLRRREDETKSQFNARKWQSRRAHFPLFEANRYLRRKYGLTLDEYNAKLEHQGHACAICGHHESSPMPGTDLVKKLAVDHCHATGKIRGLLCFRCNTVIGRINESIDLLHKMERYLNEHATPS